MIVISRKCGATVDEEIELSRSDFEDLFELIQVRNEDGMRRDGVDEDVIAELAEVNREVFEAWREEQLAVLRAWLERGGDELH
jgi:hypothetical protein